ncbi:hypothetical protein BJ138DRAFT_1149402 [Hygrophoropsis aurantiaca]|uniref:Uncharacterized protein n=1 Tax=Hygrophoropsis aurantiaca TaxID=72124 RepID=A0ACB8AFJ7_9AGAM|nr:hypothetical protein BJ138DRAFT_1149402 [Hygrophoropsis aurantiaca]
MHRWLLGDDDVNPSLAVEPPCSVCRSGDRFIVHKQSNASVPSATSSDKPLHRNRYHSMGPPKPVRTLPVLKSQRIDSILHPTMLFFCLTIATFCVSAVHAQRPMVVEELKAVLADDSMFNLFLSLVEAMPIELIPDFATILTPNLTLAIPELNPSAASHDRLAQVLDDPSSIFPLLSYHLVKFPLSRTSIATASPNHIIIPTALTDFSTVFLEPDQSQVLVLSREQDGTIHVLNQPTDVVLVPRDDLAILDDTYIWSTTSDMLVMPSTLSKTMPNSDITTFTESASAVGILDALESLHGVTLFVPQDTAFSPIESTIEHLNSVALASVLSGHGINGTFYSTQLTEGIVEVNFAGQILSSDGLTVSLSGGNTANIVVSDILLQNGVVHIIDNVLLLDAIPVSTLSVGPWAVASLALIMGGIFAIVLACCRVRGARSISPRGWKFESTSYIRLT